MILRKLELEVHKVLLREGYRTKHVRHDRELLQCVAAKTKADHGRGVVVVMGLCGEEVKKLLHPLVTRPYIRADAHQTGVRTEDWTP